MTLAGDGICVVLTPSGSHPVQGGTYMGKLEF
jgi:hypothetical protein